MALDIETDEDLLDQQPVIEDDVAVSCCQLLVGQVGVVDGGEAGLVAVSEHPAKLVAGSVDAAGNDQGGVTEVHDPDFATSLDPPPVAELSGKVGLTTMRHLGGRGSGHTCIVSGHRLQGGETVATTARASGEVAAPELVLPPRL